MITEDKLLKFSVLPMISASIFLLDSKSISSVMVRSIAINRDGFPANRADVVLKTAIYPD